MNLGESLKFEVYQSVTTSKAIFCTKMADFGGGKKNMAVIYNMLLLGEKKSKMAPPLAEENFLFTEQAVFMVLFWWSTWSSQSLRNVNYAKKKFH